MIRLAWLTDVHFNFVADDAVTSLARSIDDDVDAVVITGDISEAPSVVAHLELVAAGVAPRTVYFVLGNHDFYGGSIDAVHVAIRAMCARNDRLVWLSDNNGITLSETTALMGCDGWGDARFGDFDNSPVMLNDYRFIEDLRQRSKDVLRQRLHEEGDRWGVWVRAKLPSVLEHHERVVFATHVPPFVGACWHEGAISNADWLPHFTCKAVGDALLACAAQHPASTITVLCGHTHGAGTMNAADNLEVWTGGAEYRAPRVERIIELP